ncbi:hypothetical protein M1506_00520 [Patescibacteria group bacterium]|nr:hypothetical protein [Patescibacteria group bacterium]
MTDGSVVEKLLLAVVREPNIKTKKITKETTAPTNKKALLLKFLDKRP